MSISSYAGKFRLTTISSTLMLAAGLICSAADATVIDLSVSGSSGDLGESALFFQSNQQPTGTGVIDPFVRVKGNGAKSELEQAYNTTVNNTFDVGPADNWNHAITLGDVGLVSIDGIDYREFFLDINESNSQAKNRLEKYLSLDEIQIFMGGTANLGTEDLLDPALGTLVYDFDADPSDPDDFTDDNWVALNYGLGHGSGSGDMLFYLNNDFFSGWAETDNLVFYSLFGEIGNDVKYNLASHDCDLGGDTYCNFGASSDFEEWSTKKGGTSVPEPGPLSLLVFSLIGLGLLRRKS